MGGDGARINVISWNIAGIKNLWLSQDFLCKFDVVILQETWVDQKKQTNLLKRLNKNNKDHEWFAKPAIKTHVKGRGSGGHLVGIKRSISGEWQVASWERGLILKKTGPKEKAVIITIYNNVGVAKVKDELKNLV